MTSVRYKEIDILMSFLKFGLSTRKLDRCLGYSSSTRGWKSWEILKKYKIKNADKGKLFIYPISQSREIIKVLMKKPDNSIETLIEGNPSKTLDRYKDIFVTAKSEKAFYDIFSGETRNLIQSFFKPLKKTASKCQFKGCESVGELDTAHYSSDRNPIFMICARKFGEKLENGYFKYDVYKIMQCFLETHFEKKAVCFLCKSHHNKFDRLKKSDMIAFKEFKKNIIFD